MPAQYNLTAQHSKNLHGGCVWGWLAHCLLAKRSWSKRDKADSLSLLETGEPSTKDGWFWPCCVLIPVFIAVWKPLMLIKDLCFLFFFFSFCLPLSFCLISSDIYTLHFLFLCMSPARRANRFRRHHHKGRRERRKHKRHSHREGGHHGGELNQGHNHAHFWTKKRTSTFFPLQQAAVCLSPRCPHFPTHNSLSKSTHSLLTPPLALRGNVNPLWGLAMCCHVSPDYDKPFEFVFLIFDFYILLHLSFSLNLPLSSLSLYTELFLRKKKKTFAFDPEHTFVRSGS